ncbi:hypothetical protein [Sediminibacterium sp.]|uniref:hypothetical protein n=1 Tax=Sediminibacterium sp. TaxID=1917865 RepID=UPI003F725393
MNIPRLLKIGMLNLVLVAIIGVLMRYKIGFELIWVNQKNLQLAHSGFAFSGFVSFLLMVFVADSIKNVLDANQLRSFSRLIYFNLYFAYTTCILFFVNGYTMSSAIAQMAGLLVGAIFIIKLFFVLPWCKQTPISNWYKAAGIFYLLSLLANIWLLYMFITGKKTQHTYLAATYWFLHFQYNGWFFFGCIGLFFNWLLDKQLLTKQSDNIFWLFAISCFPAYGLSVLWLNLPFWLYTIIVVSALMQLLGMIQLCFLVLRKQVVTLIEPNKTLLLLLFISLGALLVKIILQTGSTIPFVSKLAFGFRPIVIAYLHLVLLAFTALFMISYIHLNKYFIFNKYNLFATQLFAVFVVLNEIVLGTQGIASLSYTVVPFVNEILLFIAIMLLLSSFLMVPLRPNKP